MSHLFAIKCHKMTLQMRQRNAHCHEQRQTEKICFFSFPPCTVAPETHTHTPILTRTRTPTRKHLHSQTFPLHSHANSRSQPHTHFFLIFIHTIFSPSMYLSSLILFSLITRNAFSFFLYHPFSFFSLFCLLY